MKSNDIRLVRQCRIAGLGSLPNALLFDEGRGTLLRFSTIKRLENMVGAAT